MSKLILRTAIFGILLVTLASLPATAQLIIPPGKDFWVTPANGQTYFELPDGDVEALCGAPASAAWNHLVILQGVPAAGSDYDTVVSRLDPAVFDAAGNAFTRVQLASLHFTGSSVGTPCGDIEWNVVLSGPQRITHMSLKQTSARGGIFNAVLAVDAEFQAQDVAGNYLGSLFYTFDLPDPSGGTGAGTPWSIGLQDEFRAGMTENNNCINVLRKKLSQYAPDSSHFYFISNMIAQGKCERPN